MAREITRPELCGEAERMENQVSAIGVIALHSKFDAVDHLVNSIQGLMKAAAFFTFLRLPLPPGADCSQYFGS